MLKSTFGNFVDAESFDSEFLDITISMSSGSIEADWRKNTLCAEFIAKYMLNTISTHRSEHEIEPHDIKDTINYIANEMFENAVKFTSAIGNRSISFRVSNDGHTIRFYVRNSIETAHIEPFQILIAELLEGDASEMYFERIEANIENESESTSGLGYLSIMNDYGADIAWKFEPSEENDSPDFVTTMIEINV